MFLITLTEESRNKVGVIIAVLSALLALAGISLIGVGIFIQVHIDDTLILLESYNSDVLPNFLVSVGTFMFLINLLTAKFAYDCGFAQTGDKFRMALVPLLVVMFVFIWVIFAAGIHTLSRRADVEDALHNGLRDAMKRYKNNLAVKIALDQIQMMSRCCGSRSYKDWFNTGWINTNYVNKSDSYIQSKMKNDNIYVEDVPFSCCDVKARRPCVMHNVLDTTAHRSYGAVTLYKAGCTDTLMDEFENRVLYPTGTTVMILFGAQVFVLILLRYLQTSIEGAYLEGHPDGPGTGYIFPNICCASCRTGDPDKYKEGALDVIRKKDKPREETEADDSMTGGYDDNGGDTGGDMGDLGGVGEALDMFSGAGGGGGGGGEVGGGGGGMLEEGLGGGERKEKSSKQKQGKEKTKSGKESSKTKKSEAKSKKKSKSPDKGKGKSPKTTKSPKAKSPKKAKLSPKKTKMAKTKSLKSPKMKSLKSPKMKSIKSPKMKSPRKSFRSPKARSSGRRR